MSEQAVEAAVTAAFVVLNALRVFAYLPQIVLLARERSDARVLALSTWWFWALSNATTSLYAALVLHDAPLAWLNAANTACCALVGTMGIYKRSKYGGAARESRSRATTAAHPTVFT